MRFFFYLAAVVGDPDSAAPGAEGSLVLALRAIVVIRASSSPGHDCSRFFKLSDFILFLGKKNTFSSTLIRNTERLKSLCRFFRIFQTGASVPMAKDGEVLARVISSPVSAEELKGVVVSNGTGRQRMPQSSLSGRRECL